MDFYGNTFASSSSNAQFVITSESTNTCVFTNSTFTTACATTAGNYTVKWNFPQEPPDIGVTATLRPHPSGGSPGQSLEEPYELRHL